MTLLMELQKYKTEGMQEGIEIGMKQGMEKGMEKGMKQGIEKGMEKGMAKKGRAVIVNLLKLNMPIDNIAAATESPIPYVKEIAREAGYSVWNKYQSSEPKGSLLLIMTICSFRVLI